MREASSTTIERLCGLPTNNSFFLFGARGTGKTTLLKQLPFLEGAVYTHFPQVHVSLSARSFCPSKVGSSMPVVTKG